MFETSKLPDLQTRSASGSVATFNTALAMPIINGEFAIQGYQEGSGDPALDNVRNIVGFSEINVTRAGKNLCNESELIGRKATGEHGELVDNAGYKSSQLIPIKNDLDLVLSSPNLNERTEGSFNAVIRFAFYDRSGNFISKTGAMNGTVVHVQTPINTCFVRFQCGYFAEDVQLEVGSTATAYEPYVTPTIYTKQFGEHGETIYEGSYNSITGKLTLAYVYEVINVDRLTKGSGDSYYYKTDIMKIGTGQNGICNRFKTIADSSLFGVMFGISDMFLYFYNLESNIPEITDLATAKQWFTNNPVVVAYPAEPIEIDIGAMEIATIQENNTIFADTGDVDLTYKDCDLAKRGDFRQVFKIPD